MFNRSDKVLVLRKVKSSNKSVYLRQQWLTNQSRPKLWKDVLKDVTDTTQLDWTFRITEDFER